MIVFVGILSILNLGFNKDYTKHTSNKKIAKESKCPNPPSSGNVVDLSSTQTFESNSKLYGCNLNLNTSE